MGSQQPPNKGRRKKSLEKRPWLRPGGEEIPTEQLKDICKSWDRVTWGKYLRWFESARREALILPALYRKRGEEISESIFEANHPQVTPAKQNICERILALLPPLQHAILRLNFLEGLSLPTVAAKLGRSKTNVAHHKRSALSRLKRGLAGDIWSVCRFMRGENLQIVEVEPSIWDQSFSFPILSDGLCDPSNQQSVIANLKQDQLRTMLGELGNYSQRILYLRHWCGQSANEIARDLRIGVNVVEQIEEAAIKKLKGKVIEFQTGNQMGGA